MTECRRPNRGLAEHPVVKTYEKKTMREVPKSGLSLADWDGIYSTTLTAGIHANKYHNSWETEDGVQRTDSNSSVAQASTLYVGACDGEEVYVPLSELVPMMDPSGIELEVWYLSSTNRGDAGSGPSLWTSICKSSSVNT